MGVKFWVDFDVEIHCDECMEPVHYHFDPECPVCHTLRAGTNGTSPELTTSEDGGIFCCGHCDTKFRILQYEYAGDPKDALIEVVGADQEG